MYKLDMKKILHHGVKEFKLKKSDEEANKKIAHAEYQVDRIF